MIKMKKKIIFFTVILSLMGWIFYLNPEGSGSGYSIVLLSSQNITNIKLTLPAVVDPGSGKTIEVGSFGGVYNVEERSEVETPYGAMIIVRIADSALEEIGPWTYDQDVYELLLVEKPWVKKTGDALVAGSISEWNIGLIPLFNESLHKVKLRYGLGYVTFPLDGMDKNKEFDSTVFQQIEDSLNKGMFRKTRFLFKKFDTRGMAEFDGNGTLEVTISVGGCRIKTFFFLPIPPDARDSVCYNLVGGFTTNKSGEFVPFQVVGYTDRRISP